MKLKKIVSMVLVCHLIVLCCFTQLCRGQGGESETLLNESEERDDKNSSSINSENEEKEKQSEEEEEIRDVEPSKELQEALDSDYEELKAMKERKVQELFDLYNANFTILNNNNMNDVDEEIAVEELLLQKLKSLEEEDLDEMIQEIKDWKAKPKPWGEKIKRCGSYVMALGGLSTVIPLTIIMMELGSMPLLVPLFCMGKECPIGYQNLRGNYLCQDNKSGDYHFSRKYCPHGFEDVPVGQESCIKSGELLKPVYKIDNGWNSCRTSLVITSAGLASVLIPVGIYSLGAGIYFSGKAVNMINRALESVKGESGPTLKYQLLNEEIAGLK